MSKREDNKRDKRRLIVDAARQLMQSRKSTGFSMRTLAELAGVSIATPYNLFGSKQQLIAAVMDTDLDRYRDALFAAPREPLDSLFYSVTVGRQLIEAEPHFYRMGAQSIHGETDSAMASRFSIPRHELMRDLVLQAIQAGCLCHWASAESVAVALGQQYYGWIQAWARGHISLDDLEARTHYGYALTLAAIATEDYRAPLIKRAMAFQAALPEARNLQPQRTILRGRS